MDRNEKKKDGVFVSTVPNGSEQRFIMALININRYSIVCYFFSLLTIAMR